MSMYATIYFIPVLKSFCFFVVDEGDVVVGCELSTLYCPGFQLALLVSLIMTGICWGSGVVAVVDVSVCGVVVDVVDSWGSFAACLYTRLSCSLSDLFFS